MPAHEAAGSLGRMTPQSGRDRAIDPVDIRR